MPLQLDMKPARKDPGQPLQDAPGRADRPAKRLEDRALLSAGDAEAVIPVFDGRRGHPVLLDGALLAAIGAADPAAGSMREILRGRSVSEVPWDSSIHRDIDTREDYGPLPPSLTPPPSPFGG